MLPDDKNYTAVLPSPVGYLGVRIEGNKLSGLEFLGKRLNTGLRKSTVQNTGEAGAEIRQALDSYFSDPYNIKPPVTVLSGTEFQKKVWRILSLIKPGQTRTYGDIARQLNSSPRAVGNACRRNPVPIFIPCHRVVAASGRGGFMGHTSGEPLEIKEWLLRHEKKSAAGK